ncbi:MAG TPA: sialidase family protein, partial [Rhizomicrobium sp.]
MNTLYLSATEVTGTKSSRIVVSRSTDGGATWNLVNVDTLQIYPKVDQFSDLAVADDGTVYVSWMRCTANGPTNDCGGTTASMWFSKSINQGANWSAPTMINDVDLAPDNCGAFYGCLPNTSVPVSNVPVIAVDNSASPTHGNLYVIEYTWRGFYMKTQVTVSSNGGSVWGSPIRVTPSSDTHDQFFAWINVANNGTVGVSFLDRRNDQANIDYDAFSAYSTNGGASYKDLQLSTVSSNPFNDGFGGSFLGESTGSGWGAGAKHLFAAWPDTRTGTSSQDEVGGLMP